MEMKVKRITSLFFLFCGLLLLPACTIKETSSSVSEELSRVQSLDNRPVETPASTPTEPTSGLSAAVDTVISVTGESLNTSHITERSLKVSENEISSSSEKAVPSPSEKEPQPETPAPEFPDTPPPVSSDAPSVEAMESAYLNDLLSGVNSHRSNPLNMDADLSAAAQAHAKEMAQTKRLYHSCSGVESVGKGAFEDGVKEGSLLECIG